MAGNPGEGRKDPLVPDPLSGELLDEEGPGPGEVSFRGPLHPPPGLERREGLPRPVEVPAGTRTWTSASPSTVNG